MRRAPRAGALAAIAALASCTGVGATLVTTELATFRPGYGEAVMDTFAMRAGAWLNASVSVRPADGGGPSAVAVLSLLPAPWLTDFTASSLGTAACTWPSTWRAEMAAGDHELAVAIPATGLYSVVLISCGADSAAFAAHLEYSDPAAGAWYGALPLDLVGLPQALDLLALIAAWAFAAIGAGLLGQRAAVAIISDTLLAAPLQVCGCCTSRATSYRSFAGGGDAAAASSSRNQQHHPTQQEHHHQQQQDGASTSAVLADPPTVLQKLYAGLLALKLVAMAVACGHYHALAAGATGSGSAVVANVAEALETSLLVAFLVAIALGWRIGSTERLQARAIAVVVTLSTTVFLLDASKGSCTIGDPACSGFFLSDWIFRSLVILGVALNLNYQTAQLRQSLSGPQAAWLPSSGPAYQALRVCVRLRAVLAAYVLVVPIVLILVSLLVSWSNNWLQTAIAETANVWLHIAVGVLMVQLRQRPDNLLLQTLTRAASRVGARS